MKIHFTGSLRAGRLEIGRVVKPQGVRGELKVVSLAGGPVDFQGYRQLFLAAAGSEDEPQAYRLLAGRKTAAAAVIRLAGVDDRDQAEQLRGSAVAVALDELPTLPAGEIYWHQLEDLPVREAGGREIGTVSGLLPTTSCPVLVITDPAGRELLVPVHAEFMSYRAAAGREAAFLLLTPPPGLLEINR